MHVVIRTDASSRIGTGHVMRCLPLAQALQAQGATVSFICMPMPGDMIPQIRVAGFEVRDASEDKPAALLQNGPRPDWLIVDHYGLGEAWEQEARPWCGGIMAIDDAADRPHDCDLLLDQNFCPQMETRYNPLVPAHCRQLIGPGYALLRPEFAERRRQLTPRDGHVRTVLVSMGGADPYNTTELAIESLSKAAKENRPGVNVVVGASNPRAESIQALAQVHGFRFLHNISDMAERMAEADLFIGSSGISTWERLCLGLPSLIVSVHRNQVDHCVALDAAHCQTYLGHYDEVTVGSLQSAIAENIANPERNRQTSAAGMAMVDGLGIERVCRVLRSDP